jgi:hypothetical protein
VEERGHRRRPGEDAAVGAEGEEERPKRRRKGQGFAPAGEEGKPGEIVAEEAQGASGASQKEQ